MPRVSQPLQINEFDRNHLATMMEHVDQTLKERIQIVLLCADEPSNKKVAQSLHVTEHTVAKWKEAYRKNGLTGLEDAAGKGRKPKVTVDDLPSLVLSRIELDDTEWTVHTLSEALGVSDYQISKVLNENNISLSRKRAWTFNTQETCSTADVETIGLFLSSSVCLILGCWHQYGILSEPGEVTTFSSSLAKRYSQADYDIPLLDAIVECAYPEAEGATLSSRNSNMAVDSYVEKCLDLISKSKLPDVQYRLFLWSQTPFLCQKILPSNVQIISGTSVKDTLKRFHSWAGSLTTCAHLYDVERLNETITSYYEKANPDAIPFTWRKSIIAVGTENEPIHLQIPKEETAVVPINEWLENLIQGQVEGDDLQAGFVAYVKDKNGFSYRVVPVDATFPSASEFGFDSEKSFLNGMNQLESALIKVRDQAGLTATDLYLERVKKNVKPVGVLRPFLIESELGRFFCHLSIHAVAAQMTNLRIKTAGYRKIICMYAIKQSYRNVADEFNESYHRKDTDQEVSYGTIAGDLEQEGQLLIEAKERSTFEILERFGFDPNTGLYPGEVLPEEYQNHICEMLELDIEQIMEDVTPGWINETERLTPEIALDEKTDELVGILLPDGIKRDEATSKSNRSDSQASSGKQTPKEVNQKPVKYSEPDREEIHVKHKRRGTRIEVKPEKKYKACSKFIKWFNGASKREEYGITKTWCIEKDSSDVVYIMIDVIYVTQQAQNRRKGKDVEEKENNEGTTDEENEEDAKRIGHVNIRVEVNESKYQITSLDKDEAFKELVAFILQNKLYKKYFMFFIDGEQAIADSIDKYFAKWNKSVKLDWPHLEHKCFDRLSNALQSKREADPRGRKKYYKQKSKKDQIKSQDMIARSRLYARALIRILWTGNVAMAKEYLDNLDPKEVKNQGEIARLKTYFDNKKDWITCYALRKKAGLRNSSNGVEGQNKSNVGQRQKHNGTSWRPLGSATLAALSSLFNNNEAPKWFSHGIIDFTLIE